MLIFQERFKRDPETKEMFNLIVNMFLTDLNLSWTSKEEIHHIIGSFKEEIHHRLVRSKRFLSK